MIRRRWPISETPLPNPIAIELSDLRPDRSADFSPLPAVFGASERSGLKSALLNSMSGLTGPLPNPLTARASRTPGQETRSTENHGVGRVPSRGVLLYARAN